MAERVNESVSHMKSLLDVKIMHEWEGGRAQEQYREGGREGTSRVVYKEIVKTQ